jgi:hypothetical protein
MNHRDADPPTLTRPRDEGPTERRPPWWLEEPPTVPMPPQRAA